MSRYRLDDLRALASGLGSKMGLTPIRAAEFASHLLWFDAAGASSHGIVTLPKWLARFESKQVDPVAVGRANREHPGTVIFDAQGGIGPLALEAASRIALEKARDVGIGMARVENVGPNGSAAAVVAGLAIGPYFGLVAGPGGSLAMALPMPGGLPSVFDSQLEPTVAVSTPPEAWSNLVPPWLSLLAGGDGWLVLALSVTALEPLDGFQERTFRSARAISGARGVLGSKTLEARRLESRERGLSLEPDSTTELRAWADRLGVPWPSRFDEGRSDGPAAG